MIGPQKARYMIWHEWHGTTLTSIYDHRYFGTLVSSAIQCEKYCWSKIWTTGKQIIDIININCVTKSFHCNVFLLKVMIAFSPRKSNFLLLENELQYLCKIIGRDIVLCTILITKYSFTMTDGWNCVSNQAPTKGWENHQLLYIFLLLKLGIIFVSWLTEQWWLIQPFHSRHLWKDQW